MGVKELGNDEIGRGCPKNEMGLGSPRYEMDWIVGMLGSKDQKKE